ncbi:MAG: ArsA family ATPase, partial [Candidatus Methylomirabilis sp.]|nr:ArsA family ATPase [Deltaproteobacteria bacterium]
MRKILNKRLYIVAGKGGVGKSTVSAALAKAVAATGKKVCIVQVDTHDRMGMLFGWEALEKNKICQVAENIDALNLEGRASLEEYLLIVLRSRKLTNVIFGSSVYQYFVTAAPGLKELMTIGKVSFLLDGNPSKRIPPSHDVVVLDAPATGHSINFLQTPMAVRDMINVGLVARETEKIIDLLTDPNQTCLNLVSLPEEMPVNETIELYEA